MAFEIKTSIKINATPQQVWGIFSNFENYKNWNSFITSISGHMSVSKKINITAGDMKFSPKVLVFDEHKELKWKGKLLLPYVFDGIHQFLLIDNKDGTTTFHQNESFVVFECVHRLLEKGYKPEHIELEPRWKTGHGASGGKADVLVYNQEGKVGVFNNYGNMIFLSELDSIKLLNSQVIQVYKNGKIGAVDGLGRLLALPKYDELYFEYPRFPYTILEKNE